MNDLSILTKNFVTDNLNLINKDSENNFFLENALVNFFTNNLFISNDIRFNCTGYIYNVIYNVAEGKTYLIESNRSNFFISKYFPNKTIIYRQPEFYSFIVPMPKIEKVHLDNNLESEYLISIAKTNDSSFKHLDRRKLTFKRFQDEPEIELFCGFDQLMQLRDQYKNYIKELLNISLDKIPLTKLTCAYYIISSEEITKIKSLMDIEVKALYDEIERDRQIEEGRLWEEEFNGYIDECYRAAFENNPDNYWNID